MPLPGSSTAFVCLRVPRRGRDIDVSRVRESWRRRGGREWRSGGDGARAPHATQLPTERGVLYFYRRTRQSPRRQSAGYCRRITKKPQEQRRARE